MKHAPACLAVLTLIIAAAGCGEDAGEAGQSSTTGGQSSQTRDVRQDTSRAVVRVQGNFDDHQTEATGLIYDARKGLVLTANHPVEGARTITVTGGDGRPLIGQNVARAQCRDLAVLRLYQRPEDLVAARFGDSDAVRVGDEVATLSFGLPSADGTGTQLTSFRGTVAAVDVGAELHPMLPRFAPLVAHQSPLSPTGSGAPLVNTSGEVIGINALVSHLPGEDVLEGVEYAQPSNYIRERLRQLRPGKGRAFEGWASEHRCHQAINTIAGEGHSHTGAGSAAGSATPQAQGGNEEDGNHP
jgi:putative serine protease PepD